MLLIRTTIRVDNNLKKEAEMLAVKENLTFQEIVNRALAQYLTNRARAKAKQIIFKVHNFGVPINNLTRDDIYDEFKL